MSLKLHNYWIEVLCDDGETHGAACESHHQYTAAQDAIRNAREWGKTPVEVVEISDNDTSMVIYEKDKVGQWDASYRAAVIRGGIANMREAESYSKLDEIDLIHSPVPETGDY